MTKSKLLFMVWKPFAILFMSSPIPSRSGVRLAPATVLPLLSLTCTKLIPSICCGLPLRWLAPCSHRPSLTSSLEVGHPHYIHFFPSPRLTCYYSVNFMRAESLLLCLVGCQARPPIPGAVFDTQQVLQWPSDKVERLQRPQFIQV